MHASCRAPMPSATHYSAGLNASCASQKMAVTSLKNAMSVRRHSDASAALPESCPTASSERDAHERLVSGLAVRHGR